MTVFSYVLYKCYKMSSNCWKLIGDSIRLSGKVNSPRRVYSSPRKHPQSPRGAKRGGLAPTSLASFFKMGRPINSETLNTKKNEQTGVSVGYLYDDATFMKSFYQNF